MIGIDEIRKRLYYRDGHLYWAPKDGHDKETRRWNSRFSGREFGCTNRTNYRVGEISGRQYKTHRLIYAIIHGVWPKNQIDHIDGDRQNNKIENLRDVTGKENRRNSVKPKDNKSGCVGVCRKRNAWNADIMYGGKRVYLGLFRKFDDAVRARKAAEAEHGYHPNHGRDAAVTILRKARGM